MSRTRSKRTTYFAAAAYILGTLAAPLPAFASVPDSGTPVKAASQAWKNSTNRMIVKLHDSQSPTVSALHKTTVDVLSSAAGVKLTHIRPMSGDAHVMALPRNMNLADAWAVAKKLMANPAVEYAEPDQRKHRAMIPNDPMFVNQWHYQSPSVSAGGANLPGAWDITTGSASITAAIIDTGLRPHPDIASNILDGSGRVVPGYDFISDAAVGNDGDGRDADPTDPGDWVEEGECGEGSEAEGSSWHGTHVAGTIGAISNNGSGVTGINWVSKLLPVRVLGKCGGYDSDIADAMRWSAGLSVAGVPANPNPARVLNLSLGGTGDCGQSMQRAIDAVVAANAVVVVAAGNENSDVSTSSPANCNNVIAVASVGPAGGRAFYSNYGSLVSIAAPGGEMRSATDSNGILSTLDSGTSFPGSPNYKYYQGTSMAAPHVAGIVSLMLSANPALTPAQVLSTLRRTARAFPTGLTRTCTTSICGAGIIDAAAAVKAVRPTTAGTLQFTASSAKVNEAAGSVSLLVSRINGSSGGASVNYSTASGTAKAGVDFTSVIGTLTWPDGNASTQAITIPIANDGIAEGPETFTVNLSTPSGATLGSASSATVTIVDPDSFLSDGRLPDGWIVPSGADAGWSVTTDRSYSGSYSLKSDPIGHSQKAQFEVTKSFNAGNVSFARRVSSEAGADFLRFYVDGVKQQEWAGEQGWAVVNFPISEGRHTLRWSYEKDGAGSQGSDAAWIDDVTLPSEYVPCTYQLSPGAQSLGARAASGTIDVTAPAHCAWTAASNNGWLSIASGSSGKGNGKVRYSVAANPATPLREGTLTVAGNTFTVTQTNSSINTVRNAFFINPSTGLNKTSTVRLINPNAQAGAITATAYNEAGAVVGTPDSIVGTAAAQQMLTFSSSQLETALGYSPTSSTAKYRIVFNANLPNCELINFVKDVATGNLTLAQAQTDNRAAGTATSSVRNALFVNASSSANKTSVLRVINNTAMNGALTATAYNEEGSVVGVSKGDLGTIAPQQMLTFTSAQLEAALSYTPTSGTAKYRIVFEANLPNFEVLNFIKDTASGNLTLAQEQTDNRSAGTATTSTRNALFVNPSTSTSKTSALRLINLGSQAGTITATAYDETGAVVGTANAPLGTINARQMLSFTSAQLESAIGYIPSSSSAKYHIAFSANLPDLELINYIKDVKSGNLVLGQAQIDDRTATTATSSTRNVLFVNPSTSPSKISVIRLLNLGSKSGSVTATAYDEAGNIVGADGAPVGSLDSQQMLTLTSAQLESAIGYTPSASTAKYRIVFHANVPNVEVINFIKDVSTGNVTLGQNQIN